MKMKIVFFIIFISTLSFANKFICENRNSIATIETRGTGIELNVNGLKYSGEWREDTSDSKGIPFKMYRLYSHIQEYGDLIWIFAYSRFSDIEIQFYDDNDKEYIKKFKCKPVY